ncbi:xanthine dehydrogenase family protein molybdopterin-binding subunit [Saccharolobus solfataricus]|uniref:Carbon monoxide dehydrogenase, large chain (CutA-3) n=3 Tax=Saccharolobus solfataricus TaxID=2287 RepID=Q7LX54_SACS2|nr:glyceraldehyde dehydrogenase subunit alpha [Saccharolobus solfataricus]AAK42326.1 Carbon monoxide dehydrogenase, large chain (cutA-3) [Saccharolobus solfataricus P2]AKA74940.1 xanthine dehydrogenase family protein molybdopterin-binding subunit [Saccharolobus solfataricus]AKA77636.1 xanthine dehydrogenase family protein molybdopterin-binding subunit [Saccharolobus solfataricus]AKA80327.1 xanthine dehydrogenase family protein molybdopterin-binding subunit [Saccharolobus solfataricus]AZF69403.
MYVGQRVKRKEDLKLITGSGRYIDDIEYPGTLYLYIVRSNVAHAKIKYIDVRDALKVNGVVGVITGLTIPFENRPNNWPMAKDEILYVGHPIAAILATDKYVAADAADLIQVDYEELPAVINPEKALKDDVKAIEGRSNIAYKKTYSSGDPEKALSNSDIVLEEKFEISRVYPSPMETRGLLSVYQEDSLLVYASTQSAHYMRRYLLSAFGNKVKDIRVIQADVGGAFGAKLFPYSEDFITVYASLQYRRPVKWVALRSEDIRGMYHGRGQIHKVKFGAKRDGTLTAIIDDAIIDLGAASHGTYLVDIAATMLPGPYKVRDLRVNAYGVYTNKTPLDQYRGAGRPEAAFVYERIMDIIADELKLDPIYVRKRNLITELPYVNPFGLKYDSGNYLKLLENAEKVYREFEKRANELRKQGRRVSAGLSFYLEQNNFGPWESASVRIKADGKVQVIIGASPHGQGAETGIAQIVADELGISVDDVEVIWGDTALIGEGFGTYGSRSLTLAGNAALLAARRVKDKVLRLAAQFMKSDVQELQYKDGKVINPKTGKTMSLKEVASRNMASLGGIWEYKEEPGLEATGYFGFDNLTYPYGSHVVLAEVDNSGKVKILDYYAIDDIGTVVNPMLAEAQVIGGVIQGFGESVLEEIVYDENGNLLTGNLFDYAIPTAVEAFNIKWEYMEEGKSNAPLPAKGIGEGATIGTPPALIRAIEKAIGKRLTRLPSRLEDLL